MAKSNFINYIAYENLYNANSVVNCGINPNKGIIHFFNKNGPIFFTKDASIQLGLWAGDDRHPFSDIRKKRLGDINDKDNIYTFSAESFPQNPADLQGFQRFQIKILEGDTSAYINFLATNDILEDALLRPHYNNIYFRFSYDAGVASCNQFNNCILYIEQENNDKYTYINWVSPIACGNDIKSYIKNATSFTGDLSKCIKATSSSTWTSAFKKPGNTTLNGNYIGNMKSSPSKSYDVSNLVRFQDIDLTTIKTSATSFPGIPGTPVTPKA